MFGPCFGVLSGWGKESWLLNFNRLLAVMWQLVFRVSLMVPWVGLQCVIVAFPGHTHFKKTTKKNQAVILYLHMWYSN